MLIPWYGAALLLFGSLLTLMVAGVPVAIAFMTVNVLAVIFFIGTIGGIDQLVSNATASVTTFTLAPIPLFLLMGELLFHTRLAFRVFDALDQCMGRIPGRLSYLTVGGGTLFAALSGSSMANTAMLGSTLMPEMLKRGYKPHLVMGPIMATGSLAIIIPPSSQAVLLASLARIDVGALLIAGMIPGLLLAVAFLFVIRLQVWRDPDAAPGYMVERVSLSTIIKNLCINVLPFGGVVVVVIGVILTGWATPTESAAFGALAVLLLAMAYRQLDREALFKSVRGTLTVSGMMMIIVVGSSTFSQMLAFSGASSGIIAYGAYVASNPYLMLVVMFGILLLLGMFMDPLSIQMLTIPIFLPLVSLAGFDPIWFGVIMLLALELSLVTPPFGMLLFIMAGMAGRDVSLWQVSAAALPYMACTLLLVVALAIFPGIALWLPSLIQP